MNKIRKEINLRDLGNIITNSGKKIKKGLFFRSAGLNTFNDKELEEIKKLDLKAIIDLRSKKEREQNPDPDLAIPIIYFDDFKPLYMDKINFCWHGMLSVGEKGIKQRELRIKYYENMPFANPYLKQVMELIKTKKVPFLFHCASGKDRTGVMAMVILALFDVNEDKIMQDYILSNEYRKKYIDEAYVNHQKIIKKHPELHEVIVETCGVKKEMGEAILKSVLDRYGTWSNYFKKEFSISDKLRKQLIDYYTE